MDVLSKVRPMHRRNRQRAYSNRRRGAMAIALLALAITGVAQAGDGPGYDRPGLGFAPAVLAAGDVIWEQGLPDWSRADGVSLYAADTLLRIGVGGPFELQFGTAYNHMSTANEFIRGRGDSSIGLKFALPAAGDFSWGLLGSVTFTDGARAFRGDARQYLLGAAVNWQVNPRDSLGAYAETARSGGRDDRLVALNAGRSFDHAFAAYVELAWQHVAVLGNGSMAGAGLTWQATPHVQLDAGLRHRLAGAADTWQAGFGVSVYFGRH